MRKKLLKLLECNSRLTYEEIAVMLNSTVREIKQAIQEMEDAKIILKYTTVINWEKAGLETGTAIIDVKVTPQREVGFDAVAERIYRFPEVRSVSLMSGDYDLSVVIEGKSMKEVAMFVAQKLATLEHVLSTRTHFVLKHYKTAGVIFEDQQEDLRQVVTP
ncbi:MAG: Lrp/AsnC family transcriptional regulator [Bacillota bacterium]